MRRFILMVGLSLLMISSVVFLSSAKAQAQEQVCIQYTHQIVEDNLRYLDEIYIEKYPDLGLRFVYGSREDERLLQDMADIITEGCTTDKEKADAIEKWILRNVTYDEGASAYPSAVLYTRRGNCLSYAVLMQTLLRLEGIPAVWGDGWRGDMNSYSPENLFNEAGHAWCWAYIDEEWMMYDPLWFSGGTTDTQYMEDWYYALWVENIVPVYDVGKFPPNEGHAMTCYVNGRFMVYTDGKVETETTPVRVINYSMFISVSTRYFDENGIHDGVQYLDGNRDKEQMLNGEIYTDGWILDGWWHYAYENGNQAAGTILSRDGVDYYLDVQASKASEILASKEEYMLYEGYFTVKVGYSGKPLETTWLRGSVWEEGLIATWESFDPSIVAVDQDGNITALQPGWALFRMTLVRQSDNAYIGGQDWYILVLDAFPEMDFSDNYIEDHTHNYTEIVRSASCSQRGYTIHTCTHEMCAHSYVDSYTATKSHCWNNGTVSREAVCDEYGEMVYTCADCGETKTERIPMVGHSEQKIPDVFATCEKDGLVNGVQCANCGEILKDQEKQLATGHSYGEWVQVRAPTTEEGGLDERICGLCGSKEHRQIAMIEPAPTVKPTEPVPTTPPATTVPVTGPTAAAPTTNPTEPTQTTQPVQPTVGTTEPGTAPGSGEDGFPTVTVVIVCTVLAMGGIGGYFGYRQVKKKKE